jgi:CelD/BcsL family acetyltransferase involved in cellulose biosynthesis
LPFRSFEWTQAWWRHYRESHCQLWILMVLDEQDNAVGIAPWYLQRTKTQGRVARFLGSGEVCSDYLTILAEPELALSVSRALADWLAGDGAAQWDLLDLSGIEGGDATVLALRDRLAEHGHLNDIRAEAACWRTELPGDWNQFLATLSKSRRERTRALLRKCVDSGRVVVHRVTNQAGLDRAFEVLVDLHQKRRHSLDQSGCFTSTRFTAFHHEVAGRFLSQGQLRMQWVELDARPVAIEYSFTSSSTVFYYQGGFEPEVADERPGWLSFAISLRDAIEEGYRYFDFLRGDEPSWGAMPRPLVRVRIVGRHKSARVRFSTSRACEGMKHWARRLLNRAKGG